MRISLFGFCVMLATSVVIFIMVFAGIEAVVCMRMIKMRGFECRISDPIFAEGLVFSLAGLLAIVLFKGLIGCTCKLCRYLWGSRLHRHQS